MEGPFRLATKFLELRCLPEQVSDAAMPSTAIRHFHYDAAKRELQVTFVTGRRYVYDHVPQDVFQAFKTAFSKGTFFNQKIRDHYEYREVRHERSD
jgi:hypothetical protein